MRDFHKAGLPYRLGVALCAFLSLGAAGAPDGAAAGKRTPERATEDESQPNADIQRFLGTWQTTESITAHDSVSAYSIDHYLLIKWEKNKLWVKNVDYLPDQHRWGRQSNWRGEIRVDQWNIEKQNFSPRDDGTILVSYSGTNRFGPDPSRSAWWATGDLTWARDDQGELLRLITTDGYVPTSRGNAWNPTDATYRRTAEGIDERIDKAGRR